MEPCKILTALVPAPDSLAAMRPTQNVKQRPEADAIFREAKDLNTLSSLGHFLKGSSATLGLTKVKDSCEKIQHWGAHKDEAGNNHISDDADLLRRIGATLRVVKAEYKEAEGILRKFYRESD